jgi:hypothetical protein
MVPILHWNPLAATLRVSGGWRSAGDLFITPVMGSQQSYLSRDRLIEAEACTHVSHKRYRVVLSGYICEQGTTPPPPPAQRPCFSCPILISRSVYPQRLLIPCSHRRPSPIASFSSVVSMDSRFPIAEAPASGPHQAIEEALLALHGGPPPFQWVDEDGNSLLGCYAPLRYRETRSSPRPPPRLRAA